MVDYPYILTPNRLRDFLEKIQTRTIGVPEKITTHTLPQLGFKSSNDRPIVKILKFIGFIDNDGAPTDKYMDFRVTEKSKSVMAEALRSSYSELFQLYPDAHKQQDRILRDFFAAKTKGGERVITALVNTFKTLCEFADFETAFEEAPVKSRAEVTMTPTTQPTAVTPRLDITLHIHLPQSNDPTVYDLIFQAIAKHLFKASS